MTEQPIKEQKPQNAEATQQQELVDLPDEAPQTPWKKFLLTPKFLLLVAVSLFFIGRNVYIEFTKDHTLLPQNEQKGTQEKVEVSPELYNRFYWYIILTIVFFGLYIYLKRGNDTAEQEKVREEVRRQQEEALKQKKIDEKAKKIITSMDQFGNVVDESAFKKSDEPKDQPQQSKKNQ